MTNQELQIKRQKIIKLIKITQTSLQYYDEEDLLELERLLKELALKSINAE